MQVFKLLEYLQEIVDTSAKIPISGKIIIDKKEILSLVSDIVNILPEEIKKAQWITQEKERILSEALAQAEDTKKESINMLKRQIENHDITREATYRAEEIIASAQNNAKAMRIGARDYSVDLLSQLDVEVEKKSKKMMDKLKNDIEKFVYELEEGLNVNVDEIKTNIKELRDFK